MSNAEIIKLSSEIYRLIDTQMFAIAFVKLHMLLKELSQWWANSRCEELELMCQQMLKYSLGEYADPDSEKMTKKLQNDMSSLVDDVVEGIAEKSFNSYEYELKRLTKIDDQTTYDELLNFLPTKSVEVLDDSMSNAIDMLFKKMWLAGRFNQDDCNFTNKLINDQNTESIVKQMLISALMLKSLRRYDVSVIEILLSFIREEDIEVRSRVVVSVVMIIGVDGKRIFNDIALRERLTKLFEDDSFVSEFETAFKFIINTFGTDKITEKINTEIYPELLKSSSKIQQMLKKDVGDIVDEDEINPKWEKALEEEGVTDKLREFADMQIKGADVYMSTFSSMKGYPFFKDVAHWFMPFDIKQIDVAKEMSKFPDLIKFFAKSSNMCNSDKYSFLYSIIQLPMNNFKSMMSGFGEEMDAIKEEIDSDKWKDNDGKNKISALIRSYVLDIFRFYRLFPRRIDFVNPFERIGNINDNILLKEMLPITSKRNICRFLFEVEHYEEAKPLFEYLDEQQVWDTFFYQQMGHCYQSLKMWNEAIGSYEKSDLLEPNDIWTLKHKAFCYKKIDNIEKAAECYEQILKIKEDVGSIINLAGCYVKLEDTSKARSLYYKADYLKPDNMKVMRGLAWCLFMENDYEKSYGIYNKMLEHEDFTSDDAINAGHSLWAIGEKDESRKYYKKARKLINNDVKFAEKMLDDAEYLNKIGLSDKDIVILINQILFI